MRNLKQIMIVDDDDTSNYITELLIKSINKTADVYMLSNGKEAIDYFATTIDPPELVLLDINMPLINGFEFLDYYNTKGWNGRTKFAVYSTSSRNEDKEKSMKYKHVIDYIEKPLTSDKLTNLFFKLHS